ncbi:hypothetical protein [Psychrosphaera algicola]|uniref:Capsule polysaccharide biosynthesis protein n=1 Tax=Psychrosphaera algicola TaxID=3023714 RepID=A0ABT5FJG0_9GAMM|nr:hypothetical protein [Psychrosphaera sp. G1-22]MDC2891344.1 hypothetical protein [Psychrosphaera sp. G1-22]
MLGPAIREELDRLAAELDWDVVFRPHPNQKACYDDYTNIRVSGKDEDLHTLLLGSHVVVTAISTVGIEGKLLGNGLVSIEDTVYKAAGSYKELGISTGVNDPSELEYAIKLELDKSSISNKVLYNNYSIDNLKQCIDHLVVKNMY